jgi:hypothetical protein
MNSLKIQKQFYSQESNSLVESINQIQKVRALTAVRKEKQSSKSWTFPVEGTLEVGLEERAEIIPEGKGSEVGRHSEGL